MASVRSIRSAISFPALSIFISAFTWSREAWALITAEEFSSKLKELSIIFIPALAILSILFISELRRRRALRVKPEIATTLAEPPH
jgi:hypothetical protein